jgi:hypothetical protein
MTTYTAITTPQGVVITAYQDGVKVDTKTVKLNVNKKLCLNN